MEINVRYPSPLKLDTIIISECRFKRSEEELRSSRLDVSVKRNIEEHSPKQYKITLELFINDDAHLLELSVKCVACFTTEQDNSELIEKNAIAIMFPYVRSYVSTMTSQPGMSPIVLPPMNIVAMFQEV